MPETPLIPLSTVKSPAQAEPIERLKDYLETHRFIRLRELVMTHTKVLADALTQETLSTAPSVSAEDYGARVQAYQQHTALLLSQMIIGCYWGKAEQNSLWVDVLDTIANPPPASPMSHEALRRLRLFPAMLLLYGGGIAALAAGHYDTLVALLTRVTVNSDAQAAPIAVALELPAAKVIDERLASALLNNSTTVASSTFPLHLPGHSRALPTPASWHVQQALHAPLQDILPREARYVEYFDRFEMLLALVHADLWERTHSEQWWAPPGCFSWRSSGRVGWNNLQAEFTQQGAAWPPLQVGLFSGSTARYEQVKAGLQAAFSRSSHGWF